MSWRVGFGVAIIVVLSIGAAAAAIISVSGGGGPERIKAAIRWPTDCPSITVERPSHAQIISRWAAYTADTADIVCGRAGPRVAYAKFRDDFSLNRAIAARAPTERYCTLGRTIVIDGLAGVDSTVFTDMCQNIGGTFVNNPG